MTKNQLRSIGDIRKAGLLTAIREGGPAVWVSCLFMGAANLFCGQIIKGLLMLGVEAAVIFFLVKPYGGLYWLSMLPSLGWVEQQKVWNEEKFVYEYVAGDQSQLILLYGVATAFVIALGLIFWRASVRSGYQAISLKRMGKHVPGFFEDCKALLDENIHKLLMTPPMAGLLVFTIVPLVYMMCMAFTNFSKEGDHLVLFDWVGLQNFFAIFDSTSVIGKQFGAVLSWTLIWAFLQLF